MKSTHKQADLNHTTNSQKKISTKGLKYCKCGTSHYLEQCPVCLEKQRENEKKRHIQNLIHDDLMHTAGTIVKETKGSNNTVDKIYRQACRGIQGGQVSNGPAQVGCKYVSGVWV